MFRALAECRAVSESRANLCETAASQRVREDVAVSRITTQVAQFIRSRPHAVRIACVAAAVLITLYGGLLRFEALIAGYGWMGQPAWSEALARFALPVIKALRPASVAWGPIGNPYVGADPINYLRYAREMTGFYQAHVREPLFLAITRGYLWLCGNRDIALSFASVTGSTLAIFATYLLGFAAFSRGVGLAAALALAVEFTAVGRSTGGWRDDTFMCVVVLTAWAFVRLRQQPTVLRGVIAGVAAAAACLTRITALSFVIAALLWVLVECWTIGKPRRGVAATALVCTALVAPYLIACAIAVGDPFFAINEHTKYYRAAEGLPADAPMGVVSYLSAKLHSRPITSLDTAAQGLLTFPFLNKWDGFGAWSSVLGPLLRALALVGVVLAVWSASGRFLLTLLVTSLLPYAMTWSVGSGGDWRFTQHAYPFYLVFAMAAIAMIGRWGKAFVSDASTRQWMISRTFALRVAVVAACVALAWLGYRAGPFLMYREALRAGEAVIIGTSTRNVWLFDGAWSAPVGVGNVICKVAEAPIVAMRLPMPRHTDYWLTLRVDPAETADPNFQPEITLFLNRQQVARLRLTRETGRVGSYRVRVPRELTREISRLELVASHLVRAGESGIHYAALPPDTSVAFRLWYVRLEPG
jgi:4-amino-4-deoxy-L-arabinose transferase-like glycosyltransferase